MKYIIEYIRKRIRKQKAPIRCGSFKALEMTTAEIHALTNVEDGMIVYNTDTCQLLGHADGFLGTNIYNKIIL